MGWQIFIWDPKKKNYPEKFKNASLDWPLSAFGRVAHALEIASGDTWLWEEFAAPGPHYYNSEDVRKFMKKFPSQLEKLKGKKTFKNEIEKEIVDESIKKILKFSKLCNIAVKNNYGIEIG